MCELCLCALSGAHVEFGDRRARYQDWSDRDPLPRLRYYRTDLTVGAFSQLGRNALCMLAPSLL